MGIAEWVSLLSLVVAIIALVYSFLSNTKRYELTYQYYNDVVLWHNQVVETICTLRAHSDDLLQKKVVLEWTS